MTTINFETIDEKQNEEIGNSHEKLEARKYYVYWLQSKSRCYYGATVDPVRRLRQHNEILAGGSSRTRGRGPWHFHCVIEGFHTWNDALKFEWAIKYHSKKCRSIETRQKSLDMLLQKERWTSNSPLASEVKLTIYKRPLQFGVPPENYDSLQKQKVATKTSVFKSETKNKNKTRKFKKKLYGVNY